MAGVSGVSETTGIKTRRTCFAREYEQGKRKREIAKMQREKEREKDKKRNKERERERITKRGS